MQSERETHVIELILFLGSYIIDSNLLISSLLGKLTSGIINDIILQKYELITSNQQIEEVIGVLKRAKFRDKIPMTKIQELENALKNIGTIVELYGNIFDCREPKDKFILEMGVFHRGKAH